MTEFLLYFFLSLSTKLPSPAVVMTLYIQKLRLEKNFKYFQGGRRPRLPLGGLQKTGGTCAFHRHRHSVHRNLCGSCNVQISSWRSLLVPYVPKRRARCQQGPHTPFFHLVLLILV